MAAAQPAQDSVDCMLPLQSEIVLEKNPSKSAHAKEQLLPSKDANMTTSIVQGASSLKLPKGAQEKAGFLGKGGEQPFVYQPNVYSPQPQTLFAGGYRNPSGQWEEYPHYVGVEGLDAASPMMYGAFSPVSTVGDAQPYFPLQYPFANSYYQSPASSSIGYSNSATGVIDPMLQQEYFLPDGLLFSPTPGYHQPFGSFNKAPRQPSGARGFFGPGNVPPASGMHQGSMYGSGSYKVHQQGGKFGGTTPSWSAAGHRLHTFDMGSKQEKGGVSLGGQNGYLEFMNEQNRGPRSTKPKRQDMEHSSADDKNEKTSSLVDCELYNHPDFVTEYRDAKFFVIKSYTEDHVHRSIKYRVWASTASGNRKLDCAYSAAKDKEDYCPIFLFFSVNGSGQFCGVAEMIGPVDFDKSVDYWQQDKWSGQFPVKWHIVKDVPNNLLRHIILENNDNKPVTNSRDTQEVKLELGLQMLTIFKNHEPETTVLEDFDFYEQREKAMQENRQRQQQHSSTEAQKRVEAEAAEGLATQISDTFAQAIRLEDTKNNGNKLKVEGTTAAAGKTEEDAASTNANPVEENN